MKRSLSLKCHTNNFSSLLLNKAQARARVNTGIRYKNSEFQSDLHDCNAKNRDDVQFGIELKMLAWQESLEKTKRHYKQTKARPLTHVKNTERQENNKENKEWHTRDRGTRTCTNTQTPPGRNTRRCACTRTHDACLITAARLAHQDFTHEWTEHVQPKLNPNMRSTIRYTFIHPNSNACALRTWTNDARHTGKQARLVK
jgi:hypothetical protein